MGGQRVHLVRAGDRRIAADDGAGDKRASTKRRRSAAGVVRTDETVAQRRARAKKIVARLKRTFGGVTTALEHDSALQLLVSTILSAQTTDDNVNRVTPGLYKRYPTAADLAAAPIEDLERAVHSTGFFRQKAKNVKAACEKIVREFGGEAPDTMEGLTSLPGVARKTANVVLGTWFGKNEGVVVDTHVGRLAHRLALTWRSKNEKDAAKIEADLMEIVPRSDWTFFGHALIWHGRRTCTARKPTCPTCALAESCPSAGAFG